MRSISSFAIAAALVAGGAFLAAPPNVASAKPKKAEAATPGAPAPRKLNLTKAAQPALKALETAVKNKDNAAYPAALAAAQAAATNDDEKYFIERQRYAHARDVNDTAEQLAALEAIVASPSATPPEVASSWFNIGIAAYNASNWQRANDSFAKVLEFNAADTDAMFNLALAQTKLRKEPEALATLQRAIEAKKTASQAVPEQWYRQALQLAFNARKPEANALAREVLAAYPSQENWRNALVVYREGARRDDASALDVLRLMRASKAMNTKSEYYDLAMALADAALPGEAEQVLKEASAATLPSPARPTDDTYRRVQTFVTTHLAEDKQSLPGLETRAAAAATGRLAFRTADAYLGYGDYAKAVSLYRAALAKGGADVDTGLVNIHLGIALALSGDKAGAETAFKAVTGPRADVAQLWLAWLARG